jgi:ATP-dependent DNA helicase PIF1
MCIAKRCVKANNKDKYAVLRGVSRQTTRILAKSKKKINPTGKSTRNIMYKNVFNW